MVNERNTTNIYNLRHDKNNQESNAEGRLSRHVPCSVGVIIFGALTTGFVFIILNIYFVIFIINLKIKLTVINRIKRIEKKHYYFIKILFYVRHVAVLLFKK